MLNRGWLHGRRRLTIAVGIAKGIPTFLMAWTSSPQSCPTHCSLLSEKGIVELKDKIYQNSNSHRRCQLMNTRKSVGWMFQALIISRLLGMSWKSKHKIRGDRGRPVKNLPMVKSVFLEFQFVWKYLNDLPFCRWMLIYHTVGIVTSLATAPIIEEFRRLGGNFHNCYGSYMNLFFVTIIWKWFMVNDFDHYVLCRVWSSS